MKLTRRRITPWPAAALLLGGALAVLPLRLARGDPFSDWEAMREQQRRSYESMVSNMPVLEKHTLQDVLQVRMENKALVVKTPLSTTQNNGFMRAKLDGVNGFVLILVQRNGTRGDASEPNNFQFNLADYSTKGQINTLTVNTQATFFNISKSVQYASSAYRSVQLMEQRGGPQSGGSGVMQLSVQESGIAGSAAMNLSLEAGDFFTFLRRYPRESDQYVRPLLRELGQEQVFAPDPLVAWQVFGELWKPDPEVRKKIEAVLHDLNDNDYHQRDAAQRKLQEMGRDGAAVMVHLDRSGLSPEQNARIDRALAPYAQLPLKEAVRLHSDVSFLLDCLYGDEATLRQAAVTRLKEIVGPDVKFDVNADAPARANAIAALRNRLVGPHAKAK